jgi:hypothetical protein
MSSERYVKTSVSIREDQKDIIQNILPQKISEHVRNLLDALIAGTNLSDLPPEIAEKVVQSRMMAKIHSQNAKKELELKESFHLYLDSKNYAKFISRYSKRKCLGIGKDLAYSYKKFEGNILPDCYILPFLLDYYELTKGSPKMIEAYQDMNNNVQEPGEGST